MNTTQLRRTSIATSALAAALTLLTVADAPIAGANRPEPGFGSNAHSVVLDIDQLVAMRKEAAAQYYVDHAGQVHLA